LANLIDNAVKYTPRGGAIRLTVGLEDEEAVVTVCDSGPGIAADDRARAVRRFERLEGAARVPGRGLGLSLVAAVAALHGGSLSLSDNQPGLCARLSIPREPVRTP
jgi:signal transduction histidine kinase